MKLPSKYRVKEKAEDSKKDMNRVSNRFDCCIWGGDFNFRIKTKNLTVMNLIKSNEFEILKKNESLSLRFKAQRLPDDFIEGPIEFAPTYKLVNNTDKYNNK